jgi:hypothetical protein
VGNTPGKPIAHCPLMSSSLIERVLSAIICLGKHNFYFIVHFMIDGSVIGNNGKVNGTCIIKHHVKKT